MWRMGVLVAWACACNQVFDIRDTRPPDSDADGLSDGDDNCPLVANHDQANADHDALGDACDPCIAGPQSGTDGDGDGIDDACDVCPAGRNSDEDDDGVSDGCDVCPGTADDQADADGDGIGDVCDRGPGLPNQRVTFDGFNPPHTTWVTGFQDWVASGGSFGPLPWSGGGVVGAYDPVAPIAKQDDWWAEAVVRLPPSPVPDRAYVAMELVNKAGSYAGRDCIVQYGGGVWTFGSATAITVGAQIRMLLHASANGTMECIVDGRSFSLGATPTGASWFVELGANPHWEFEWIDTVQ